MYKGEISALESLPLGSRFKKAIDYVWSNKENLQEGRNDLYDGIFAIYCKGEKLRPIADAPLEAHREYIDIQIVVAGQELFGHSSIDICTNIMSDYDSERDIIFFEGSPKQIDKLTAGMFIVFYPEDAHAPLIGEGLVDKIVIKLPV